MVSFNLFFCPYISCKQVIISRDWSRIRFDFLATRLEFLRLGNEVIKSKTGGFRKKGDTCLVSPSNLLDLLSLHAGERRRGCAQASAGLASRRLCCWGRISLYQVLLWGPFGTISLYHLANRSWLAAGCQDRGNLWLSSIMVLCWLSSFLSISHLSPLKKKTHHKNAFLLLFSATSFSWPYWAKRTA